MESPAFDSEPVSLRSLLETLPQEIYDHIVDLTFTCDGFGCSIPAPKGGERGTISNIQYVNKAYRPPVQLQINSETRKRFLPLFYSSTTFIVADSPASSILRGWMLSLSQNASVEIRAIREYYRAGIYNSRGHDLTNIYTQSGEDEGLLSLVKGESIKKKTIAGLMSDFRARAADEFWHA